MFRSLLVASLIASSLSFAQQQPSANRPAPKEIVYEDGDLVSGGVEGPTDMRIVAPPDRTPHTSLIQIRDSFADKVTANGLN